jgi:hypothetical protein
VFSRVECPLCCDMHWFTTIIYNENCGHQCCESCLKQYLTTDLSIKVGRIRRGREVTIRCFGGCGEVLDRNMVYCFGADAELRKCIDDLSLRESFISRWPKTK